MYLEAISEYRCCIWSLACDGPTQVHHLLKPWVAGRGMGMRADDRNVVPLCAYHHRELHTKYGNEFKFFEANFLKPTHGQDLAKSLWIKHNPDYEAE